MFLVSVVCSDPDCAEERELVVGDLDEVDEHACECGYGFALIAIGHLGLPPHG